MKTIPDATNIPAIQHMLRNAYDWGVRNGYITFNEDGQPVFAVPPHAVDWANGEDRTVIAKFENGELASEHVIRPATKA